MITTLPFLYLENFQSTGNRFAYRPWESAVSRFSINGLLDSGLQVTMCWVCAESIAIQLTNNKNPQNHKPIRAFFIKHTQSVCYRHTNKSMRNPKKFIEVANKVEQ
ncbi:MAG: hypothetical protein ABJK37_02300 [Paraglaciecola sp.]|uniref:hypothetical protein n=1 Tax=Paraglaciecola sp. TaxID=1920173 RepID=UPI003296F24C